LTKQREVAKMAENQDSGRFHEMRVSKNWNLMATHGVVLFYIAANPESTMRQMSESLNLTERRIAQVVRDLAEADLLTVTRNGRRNSYAVNPDASFRHPTLSHIRLGHFVRMLSGSAVAALVMLHTAMPWLSGFVASASAA
jgi:DNA-binding IscR family transcriptional regulator